MKVLISGQHINIGDSLRTYIEEKIEKHVTRFFEHAVNAHINLTQDKNHIIQTKITINQGADTRAIIQSSGEDSDGYRSFDIALHKAETQLKKHRSRMKKHHVEKLEKQPFYEAKNYILSPFSEEQPEEHIPVTIAEKMASIQTLTVSEAIMKMDLLEKKVLIFINSGNDRVNVVYYREDGNIAWVDVPAIK